MSCTDKNIGKNLKDYAYNRLSEEDAELFEIHLFECEKCSKDLEILDTMRTISHEMEADAKNVLQPTPSTVAESPKPFNLILFPVRLFKQQKLWIRVAAAIIFFCVIGSATFFYMGTAKYPPKGVWQIPYPKNLSYHQLRETRYPLGNWPEGVWVYYEFDETVMPGDVIKIVAEGEIDIAPEMYKGRHDLDGPNFFDPDGGRCFPEAPRKVRSSSYILRFPLYPDIEDEGFASESDGFFCYALIGKFNDSGHPFVIGKSRTLTITETIDGIFLAINDEFPADNQGFWEISVFRLINGKESRLL